MKRYVALPIVAASVLFCLSAFAGDAAILPETVQAHWLIALMAILIPAIRTGLSDDTVKLPTVAAPYRMLLIAALAGATILVDGLANGFTFKMALASFLANGLPSLVQEILKIVFGEKSKPVGAMFPPVAMLMVAALAIGGCAAKPYICPIIETASELCQFLVVRLPDGSTEIVPKSAVVGMAMNARAARVAGAAQGATDAGADSK